METKYIKRDGKIYRQEINEEEYDVDAMIAVAQEQLNSLNVLKSTTISNLEK